MSLVPLLLPVLPLAADPVPTDDDVVAGPAGALVIGGLIIATALLLWAFTRQLRRAQRAGLPSKKDETRSSTDASGVIYASTPDSDGTRHHGQHGSDSRSDSDGSGSDSGGGGGDSGGGDSGGGDSGGGGGGD